MKKLPERKLAILRSSTRISPVLVQLKTLWGYYPEHSLSQLLYEIIFAANLVESEFMITNFEEIEEIANHEKHILHDLRSIEIGIAELNR